ncbi:RES family NAD+ phosphorylase [Spirosoma aerophilum]
MWCCANCFGDQIIKIYINTNATNLGDCNYCGTKKTAIIQCLELYDQLVPLVGIYKKCEDVNEKTLSKEYLWNVIKKDWPSFFNIEDAKIEQLLKTTLFDYNDILSNYVEPSYQNDEIQELRWQDFIKEIKNINRFFITNLIDTKLLEELLGFHAKPYFKGKYFYRSRISPSHKFTCDEMGKPPYEYATAGRANPKGISYLYVSDNESTTLYETRASLLDYVTIGKFKLEEDLNVVNLKDGDSISPILLEDSIGKYMSYRNYLLRLGQELSKPIRKQDSELDYLPTQYLCELIKSLGFDGVEYKSSLNPTGFNLAIFNDQKFKCISTKLIEVKSINYEMNEITDL